MFTFGFNVKPKKTGGVSYDADASAFFTATGITDTTQKSAVNQLVLDLKSYNIWSKMKALYPIVGGTSTTHKYNLINPADTDAAFRLSFATGWTHTSTGMLPNGSAAYADTFLTPSTSLSLNSAHLSFYSRTNSTGNYADIGSGNNSTSIGYLQILSKWSDNKFYAEIHDNDFSDNTVSDSLGFFLASRINSTNVKTFKSGITITTKTSATSTFSTSLTSYIGARNLENGGVSSYSNRQCAFASIGDGLTDTEAANFYTAVQAYQTTLSRNV